MLISLSDRFAKSRFQRHLLFLAATAVAIAFMGYYFGTFDQVIHIPFLKKDVYPALYPGDPFFELRGQHYSYFWFLFWPFYRLGVLEPAMFVAHVLATYATFWALWRLSDTLFQNPLTNLLTVVVFALPHIGFAGFPVFEFSLLNRTFVLPFLLGAIVLFLRRRYVLAFALLGLMYNLHIISVNFVLGMFLFDCVLEFRAIGWRPILFGLMAFVVTALPVIIWKLDGPPTDFSLRPEWLSIVARSVLFNIYYLFAPYPQILSGTVNGLSVLVIFFMARRRAPSARHDRTVTHFTLAVLLILAVEVVTAYWLPVTLIVQLQIIRAGVFALIFGYVYFANYLAEAYRSRLLNRFDFGVLAAATVFSSFPVIVVIVRGLQHLLASVRLRQVVTSGALIVMYAGSLTLARYYDLWRPGLHIYPENTPWHTAQLWARDHTPPETVFITPPGRWWFYDSEWRVLAERPTVVTLAELIDAAFSPQYLNQWIPRFDAVAPGALSQFKGDVFENLAITERAFYGLSADDLLRVARQYGASYLVVEKPHRRDFPVVYENEQFVIYDLRSAK